MSEELTKPLCIDGKCPVRMEKSSRETIFGLSLDWRSPMKCPRSEVNVPKGVVVVTGHQAFGAPRAEVVIAQ